MTAIELYDYVPRVWESMTDWIDAFTLEDQEDHETMIGICDSLHSLFDELYFMQEDMSVFLTPANRVLSHRLQLRLDDIDDVLDRKFRSPTLKQAAEVWLAGLAAEAVGPLADVEPVVFQTISYWQHSGLLGYVRSVLVESPHALRSPGVFQSAPVVVTAPRWAYRYLVALSEPGDLGVGHRAKLMERRLAQDPFPRPGVAVPVPSEDVLETALSLWCPSGDGGPYGEFSAAVAAAEQLCAR
jgi:hypothetical protein